MISSKFAAMTLAVLLLTVPLLPPTAAAELQPAPVMDGSGAFLGAPGISGPGYLAPDPVPLILDELTLSIGNPSLQESLADAYAWARAANRVTTTALGRHRTASSWSAFTELRAKRASNRAGTFVSEMYRSGGDLYIFLEDLVNGVDLGRSLHDQALRNHHASQLAARAAAERSLAASAAAELEQRRTVLTSTASAEIAARAWLGQLLALDRITAGSSIDEISVGTFVELLASRLPALVDDVLAAQQLPALTTPDRRRALAAADTLAPAAGKGDIASGTDASVSTAPGAYEGLDLIITGDPGALNLLKSQLPSSVRSAVLRSASIPAGFPSSRLHKSAPNGRAATKGTATFRTAAPVADVVTVDETGTWLLDSARFTTKSSVRSLTPAATPVEQPAPTSTPSATSATPGPSDPAVQEGFAAAGVLLAASHRLFPGDRVQLGALTLTITELQASMYAPHSVLLDERQFASVTGSALLRHHLVVDVRPDPQGARVLAALRSVAPTLALELRSLTGAPEPSRFETPTAAAERIGAMPYTITDTTALQIPVSFTTPRLGYVSLPLLGRMTCSLDAAPQMAAALTHLAVIGYGPQIAPDEFGGCFNPRLVSGTTSPSFHARGLALDLGVPANLQGSFGALDPGLISVFKSWGFRWGGDWVALDPMHFEVAALLSRN